MFGKPDTWLTSQPPRYNERGRRFDIIGRSHEKLRLRLKDCRAHQPQSLAVLGALLLFFYLRAPGPAVLYPLQSCSGSCCSHTEPQKTGNRPKSDQGDHF